MSAAPGTVQGSQGFFTHKALDITFKLGQGDFGEAGFDTITLRGLRVSATVNKVGQFNLGEAQLRIWGMTLDQMNKLSTLGQRYYGPGQRMNPLLIEARAGTAPASTVFVGDAWMGFIDFGSMPQVSFVAQARPGLVAGLKPVPTSSYRGVADVAAIMSRLAATMGYNFENNGVTAKVVDQYLPGTALEQAKRLAEAAGINMMIDDNTLAIWPKNEARSQQGIPLISERTGLVLAPSFDQSGIQLTAIYDPRFKSGGKVKVDCILKPANRTWTVYALTHTLESEMPKGNWFTRLLCYDPAQGSVPLTSGSAG